MDESSDEADAEDDDGDYQQDRPAKRKRNSGGKRKGKSIRLLLYKCDSYTFHTEATPLTDSDSASDFGSETPAKKKKKKHHDGSGVEDFRFSTRGIKLPNYYENDEDASMDDESDEGGDDQGISAPTEQVHEIEMVLDHHRDDEKKDEPADNFLTNMVCLWSFGTRPFH